MKIEVSTYSEAMVEIIRLRAMVDGLLDELPWPIVALDGRKGWESQCPYCKMTWYRAKGERHDDDCPYQRAQQARDWKPGEVGDESREERSCRPG